MRYILGLPTSNWSVRENSPVNETFEKAWLIALFAATLRFSSRWVILVRTYSKTGSSKLDWRIVVIVETCSAIARPNRTSDVAETGGGSGGRTRPAYQNLSVPSQPKSHSACTLQRYRMDYQLWSQIVNGADGTNCDRILRQLNENFEKAWSLALFGPTTWALIERVSSLIRDDGKSLVAAISVGLNDSWTNVGKDLFLHAGLEDSGGCEGEIWPIVDFPGPCTFTRHAYYRPGQTCSAVGQPNRTLDGAELEIGGRDGGRLPRGKTACWTLRSLLSTGRRRRGWFIITIAYNNGAKTLTVPSIGTACQSGYWCYCW
ncbi:hypothetical protein EDD18DRAFT_1100925 [Armillaria luteobubalina]|uniref:Uncharacterized protein n=1 Tax=Armillaria luteobubalina TaxID=153913 RepID=A0AA39QHK3_9AGAR|nr:hypothetical protein EDD18DRAFT_1100925 [Armillaria luteobubalina]